MSTVDNFDGILVVGGGLVGAMSALQWARNGFSVRLIEKREDWRAESIAGMDADSEEAKEELVSAKNAVKRSINLALSVRGQSALRNVGLLEQVMAFTVPMRSRAIHSLGATGEADSFQPYDEVDAGNYINSVSREDLNNLLLNEAEAAGVDLRFGLRMSCYDKDGVVHFERDEEVESAKKSGDGSRLRGLATYNDYTPGTIRVKPRLLLGCDGAYSCVREAMQRLVRMDFSRKYISHGYKEMTIPPTAEGEFAMKDVESLHIWPRGLFMMIGLPNPDKSFTCTIFAPLHSTIDPETGKSVEGLRDLKTKAQVRAYFERHFPDAIGLMPEFEEEYLRNPACTLVTTRASPWNLGSRAVIIGDAAHAIVPFYGQGMNAGLEDALEMDLHFKRELLGSRGGDTGKGEGEAKGESKEERDVAAFSKEERWAALERSIPTFAKAREPTGSAIADLSFANYVEMRHHTASPIFLLRKKFEGVLNYLFPKSWIPLYKMVAFTRIPYHEAIEREKKQASLLSTLVWASAAGVAVAAAGVFAAVALGRKGRSNL